MILSITVHLQYKTLAMKYVLFISVILFSSCGSKQVPVDNPSFVDRNPQFGDKQKQTKAPILTIGGKLTKAGKVDKASIGNVQIDGVMTTYDNKQVAMSSFDGKPKVLGFWASWCGPCVKEKPIFKSYSEKYPDIQFLSLSVDEVMVHAEEFFQNRNIEMTKDDYWIGPGDGNPLGWYTLKTVDDGTGQSAIIRLPTYVLISEEGKILENDLPRPSEGRWDDILSGI